MFNNKALIFNLQRLLLFAFVLLTFLYCVTWQFAQFVSLLQAMSLFGVGLIKQTSTVKVRKIKLPKNAIRNLIKIKIGLCCR